MSRKLVINLQDDRSRWAITPDAVARIRAALPHDWQLVQVNAPVSSRGDGGGVSEEALAAVRDAEVYIGFGFPRALLAAATRLKWVHSGSAGVGSLLYPEMLASAVVLTNSAGIHAEPMAETVLAMVLHFARGLDFAVRSQTAARWDQSEFESADSPIVEINRLRMGILGYGGIGRAVARRAHALGMQVLATRRSGAASDEHAEVIAGDTAGTERVLRESDVLVIALPATKHTRGLLCAAQLAMLRNGVILVNVSRGSIVDEAALIEVLRSGRLRGAALDVYEHEPLAADSPFWTLPNVLVLPHISATTPHFWERQTELIVQNIANYLAGEPLLNEVDKQQGY